LNFLNIVKALHQKFNSTMNSIEQHLRKWLDPMFGWAKYRTF